MLVDISAIINEVGQPRNAIPRSLSNIVDNIAVGFINSTIRQLV
jgi:hypothetical protein